jgi:hypothetical protein
MRQPTRLAVFAVLVVLIPMTAGAQRFFRDAVTDIRNGVGDTYYILASPTRADGKDWATFGGVMAITALSSIVDDNLDAWIVERDAAGAFDFMEFFREREDTEWSDIGAARILSKLSLGIWVVGLATDSEGLRDAGMGCLATWIGIAGTREINYRIWWRARPSHANGDQYLTDWGHGQWPNRSFVAGHFANPMGCTKLWADRFELGVLEPAMYATSYFVAVSRMVDRRHWLSDVIVAGALGYAAGKIVAHRQNERRAKAQADSVRARMRETGILRR